VDVDMDVEVNVAMWMLPTGPQRPGKIKTKSGISGGGPFVFGFCVGRAQTNGSVVHLDCTFFGGSLV